MKAANYKGMWFLPNKEEKYYGEVHYTSENGIELDLFGCFDNCDIILGETNKGCHITLYKCFSKKTSRQFEMGFDTSIIVANFMFVGLYLPSKTNMYFTEIGFNLTNLDEWICSHNFSIEHNNDEKTCKVEYSYPTPIEVALNNDYKIILSPITKTPPILFVQKAAKIEEQNYIHITSQNANSLENLFDVKYIFECFFELATNRPQNVLECFVITEDNKKAILYSHPFALHVESELFPVYMPFCYSYIRDELSVVFKRWYNVFCDYDDIFKLYFSSVNQKDLYIQQRFLNYSQFLESYHRKKYHKNTMCLNNRLVELCKKCICINEIIINSFEIKRYGIINDFVEDIKISRNYYTHYDKKNKNKAVKGIELYYLTERMNILIKYYILLELGFENKKVVEILNRTYHFDYEENKKQSLDNLKNKVEEITKDSEVLSKKLKDKANNK